VEHLWIRPGTDRPTVRPHIVVMVAALVAMGALLTGVAWQLIRPAKKPVAKPQPLPVTTLDMVSGWDCSTSGTYGFDISGRTADWSTVTHGGWASDGCLGSFEAIPMSGDPVKNDPNLYALWWFSPGPDMSRCNVFVYVPEAERPSDAGATEAHYLVLAGRPVGPVAQFVINQAAHAGEWVAAGQYASSGGNIAVRLDNRGKPEHPSVRIAVAQVKVTCSNS
jgi:hypothetical protein